MNHKSFQRSSIQAGGLEGRVVHLGTKDGASGLKFDTFLFAGITYLSDTGIESC